MFLHVVRHLHATQAPARLLQHGDGLVAEDSWGLPSLLLLGPVYDDQSQVWLRITLVPGSLREVIGIIIEWTCDPP